MESSLFGSDEATTELFSTTGSKFPWDVSKWSSNWNKRENLLLRAGRA